MSWKAILEQLEEFNNILSMSIIDTGEQNNNLVINESINNINNNETIGCLPQIIEQKNKDKVEFN